MDESPIRPISSILWQCPECQGIVRLPSNAISDLTVRCPHCSASFSMQRILQQIPELEVVSSETKEHVTPIVDRVLYNGNPEEKKKFVVPPQLSKGAKRKRRGRRGNDTDERKPETEPDSRKFNISTESVVKGNSEFLDPSIPLTPDPEIRSRRKFVKVHSSQRHRRRKKESTNSQLELFKVVLGGLLAFPIAYLIIMWVFGQDPLSLGKSVGQIVPFAFPESFRQSAENRDQPVSGEKDRLKSTNSELKTDSSESDADDVNSSTEKKSNPSNLSFPGMDAETKNLQIPDVAPDSSFQSDQKKTPQEKK